MDRGLFDGTRGRDWELGCGGGVELESMVSLCCGADSAEQIS